MPPTQTRFILLLSLIALIGAAGCISRDEALPTRGEIERALRAASDKRWDDVRAMLDETPALLDYNKGTVGGYSLLCYALEHDDLDTAMWLLAVRQARGGDTAGMETEILMAATRLGDFDLVVKMVESGADTKTKRLLLAAIVNGDARIFDYLLRHGADIHETNDCGDDMLYCSVYYGRSAFAKRLLDLGLTFERPVLDAAVRGDCTKIKRIVKRDPKALYSADPKHRLSVLHIAAGLRYHNILETALKLGLDVDTRNQRQETPLFFAGNQPQIAQFLLDNGAQVNARDKYEYTPIFSADENPETTRLLLEHGADPNARPDRCFVTLLQGTDNREVMKLLLDAGNDPNELAQWAVHILPYSCARADIRDIRLLLDHGADPNYPGSCGFVSSLASAIKNNRADVVELLLERGAVLELHEVVESHLCYAVKVRRFDMMRLLMKHGATLHSAFLDAVLRGDAETVRKMAAADKTLLQLRDEFEKRDALSWAIMTEQPAMVRVLLDCGADPNLAGESRDTAVHLAAEMEALEIMRMLLAAGGDPNVADTMGTTPIHLAAANGDLKMIKLLLSAGADINAKHTDGDTALSYIVASPCEDGTGMRFLIEHGAELDSGDDDTFPHYMFVLHRMAANGHRAAIDFLLARGADINVSDKLGATALTEAVCADSTDMVEFLVGCGADVFAVNDEGTTLLHKARSREMAELLISYGLDVNAKNQYGLKPLEYGYERQIGDVLIAHGATIDSQCTQRFMKQCNSLGLLEFILKQGVSVELSAEYQYELFRFYSFDMIKTLLNAGLRIDTRNPQILEAAVTRGSLELVEYLVAKGTDVNAKGADFPPLFVAAREGWWDIADFLLAHGADVNGRLNDDEDEPTVLGIAEKNGHKNIAKLLRAHGAKHVEQEEE